LLERDLQDFLFANPDVLLPGEVILEKSREAFIGGKRIDLLFRTASASYIIELKAVPLTREHIGQVIEYYGLLRSTGEVGSLMMVLVAPSIPDYRKIFLKEIGIRCVEIASVPSTGTEVEKVSKDSSEYRKRERVEEMASKALAELTSVGYQDLLPPVSKRSLAISHRFLRDSLPGLREIFSEYEIKPVKMLHAGSHDGICGGVAPDMKSVPPFVSGGAWWAYGFGALEQMAKNDVPNISAVAMPWCFDLAVNAELQTSQRIVKARIRERPSVFDRIIADHGELQFQAILKIEHQPRFYFWIPLAFRAPGTWSAASLLECCSHFESDYSRLKENWLAWIELNRPELTKRQAAHMRLQNKNPNIALRLVHPFPKEDEFWSMPFRVQCDRFTSECGRLKPLIDFLR
jgi:hypothetical protein